MDGVQHIKKKYLKGGVGVKYNSPKVPKGIGLGCNTFHTNTCMEGLGMKYITNNCPKRLGGGEEHYIQVPTGRDWG